MKLNGIRDTRKFNIILVSCVLLITTILQLSLCNNINVWQDEIYTMLLMKSTPNFWDVITKDVHPPLYYLILKPIAMLSNYNISIAKIVSIIPILLMNITLIVLTLKEKRRAESKVTGVLLSIFIIATTLTYNFLEYSVELRMYSLAMLFVTLSGIWAYKVYSNPNKKNIIIFIILSLGSAYTHYYALVMECIIYFYLFLCLILKDRKNIKKVGIISGATIIGYLPWIYFAIKQIISVKSSFWVTFQASDILDYIRGIISANNEACLWLQLPIVILLLALSGYHIYKTVKSKEMSTEERQERWFGICAFSVPFITIILGIIVNIIYRPAFLTRYIFPALGLFWIGIIIMLKYAERKKILISCLSAFIIVFSVLSYRQVFAEEYTPNTQEMIDYLSDNIEEDDIIICGYRLYYGRIMDYLLPDNEVVLADDFKTIVKDYEEQFENYRGTLWLCELSDEETDLSDIGYAKQFEHKGCVDTSIPIDIYKLTK